MKASNLPLVSVYIPTHNRADMLINAVNSVLKQTYKNIEIIVVDDGSTDNTAMMIEPYVLVGKVKYLKNDVSVGACAARNSALNIATGDLITGLDDDDLFLPGRISELVECFISGSYSCVTSGIIERTLAGDIHRTFDSGVVTLDSLLHQNILGNQILTSTDYLRAIGGFDQLMPSFQDYDTWIRLVSEFGDAFKINSSSYVWITSHEGERITTSSAKKTNGFELFYAKHKEKMQNSHIKTHEILRKRLFNQSYSYMDFMILTSKHNWRQSLTLLIDRNLPWLKEIHTKLRAK